MFWGNNFRFLPESEEKYEEEKRRQEKYQKSSIFPSQLGKKEEERTFTWDARESTFIAFLSGGSFRVPPCDVTSSLVSRVCK